MVPIIKFLKIPFKIDFKSFVLVIISAIVIVEYMRYFFLGTKYGTASLGGAFVTTLVPINTFLLLAILGKRRVGKKELIALILGAIGVMSMLNVWKFDSSEIFAKQNIYFLIASSLWPILTIVSSKATKVSPLVFTFYLYLVAVLIDIVFFVDFKAIRFEEFDSYFWINIASMTLLATTFANTIYFVGIERLGSAEVSSFIFLVPFFAIALSAVFLKEHISASIIFGTILTLISIKILNNIKLFIK
jgi:drug/metabolite transporter (DMT)-like permease